MTFTISGPRPWQPFADYYYAGTDSKRRVDASPQAYADRWGHLYNEGDPVADRLALAIIERKVSRKDFESALTGELDPFGLPSPELGDFLESVRTLPGNLDAESIARGAETFLRLPMPAWTAHGAIAGFMFGAIQPNSALAMAMNEGVAAATHKRYVETAKYVYDLLVDPAGASAFRTACRVRLVHGFVRTEITRNGDWNQEAYGAPINLAPMLVASAVQGPWAVPLLEKQGYRLSRDEKNDIAMFGAYQAFLQGVPAAELLTTHDAYSDFLYFYLATATVPLPADRPEAEKVLRPLLENGYPISESKLVTRLFNAFIVEETRRSFGPALSREWRIEPSLAGRATVPIAAGLNRALGTARRSRWTRPLSHKMAEKMVHSSMPQMVERVTGDREVKFDSAAKKDRVNAD